MAQVTETLRSRLPHINPLLATTREALLRDVGAGILLSLFLVPVGMAYAQASGLSPIYGLYATVVPMAVYGLVGPSRLLVLGPDSSLAPLIAATVLPLAAQGSGSAATMAAALAIGTGILSLAAGLGGLGLLTELLSLPVRRGYLIGVALVVGAGQLPLLLSIEADGETLEKFGEVIVAIARRDVNLGMAAIGVGSLASLIILGRLRSNLFAVATTVIAAIVAIRLLGSGDDLAVVGSLPRGAPELTMPSIGRGELGPLAIGAISIALVSFADTSVLSQSYATREARQVDPNRELVALGVSNLVCGVFQGFPVSGSSSRTPVLESAGARSQAAGLVAAATVLILISTAPDALSTLPVATLAAVLIVSVSRLVNWNDARRLLKTRPGEFALSMLCAGGVVVAGPLWGIGLAVAMSLLAFLHRSWRPHTTVLVRIKGLKGYHDSDRHPEGRQIPGLLLYRFDAPLFFANAEVFRKDLTERLRQAGPGITQVIVTAEPMTDIDATAEHTLLAMHEELKGQGVQLGFAELKGVVRDQLQRSGAVEIIGPHNFHPTVGRAVRAHLRSQKSE